MKSILGIINQPPFGNSSSHEGVEMLMVYAAFGFHVSILLRGAGVLHLQQGLQPEVIDHKNHSALFAALDLYDIKTLLVDENALTEYQCQAADNLLFELLSNEDINTLIANHTEVLNF